MSRRRLDPEIQRLGQRLTLRLTEARHNSGRSAEATSTPEFFTVAALATELGLSLDELYAFVRQRTLTAEHESDEV
jgi:hypothetical protein